jgi:tetratricopeptide (TPR) repeat protein
MAGRYPGNGTYLPFEMDQFPISFFARSRLRFICLKLLAVTACLLTSFSSLAQSGTIAISTSDLRKQLGIPSNEVLALQSERDFLLILHKNPSIWVQYIKFKDQIPALLKDLSGFSRQQDKVVKLRIRMLIFWLKCNFGQMDSALFQNLLKETIELGQKNLQVNLLLLKCIMDSYRPALLLENFWLMHEVADIMANEPDTEFTNKGLIFLSMGSLFYQVGDMANALKYLRQASENTSGTHLKLALNTLGYVHRKLKNLDSSDLYFEQTLANAQKSNDSIYIGLASGNLGENFYLRKQFDKAIPLLETDLRIGLARKDYGLVSNAQLLLSEMYLRLGERQKAGIFLNFGRENALRSKQYHRLPFLYSTSALYFTSTGQIGKAIAAQDSLKIVSDSMVRKAASIQTMNPELVYQDKKAREESFRIKVENDANLQKRNTLVYILFAGIVMLVLVFWNIRLRARIRLQGVLKDKQKLEMSVAEAKDALDQMADNLAESSRHLAELKESKSEQAGQELRAVEKITDNQWSDFRTLFDKAHPEFMSSLKEQIPNLTPSEIRLAMLVRMHMKDGKMAEMLGVGQDAIRKTRSRLRQKITLKEGENLEDFILSV